MRLATYNTEWFDALFDNKGRLHADGGWSARHDITRLEQTEALGHVFTAMDADAVIAELQQIIPPKEERRRRVGRRP